MRSMHAVRTQCQNFPVDAIYTILLIHQHPVTNFMKKSNAWLWTSKEEEWYQELKKKISSTKCQGVHHREYEIILITDASDVGVVWYIIPVARA